VSQKTYAANVFLKCIIRMQGYYETGDGEKATESSPHCKLQTTLIVRHRPCDCVSASTCLQHGFCHTGSVRATLQNLQYRESHRLRVCFTRIHV